MSEPRGVASTHPDHCRSRYRPTTVAHLVGNGGNVARLNQWLRTWHEERERAAFDDKPKKGAQEWHRAALLSGPPGVGKTSAAKAVLLEAGYDVVELNASDTRSQKALQEHVADMMGNTSLASFASGGGGGARAANGQMALIMDECDGMSSGDRGGMAQLIALIKKSKMPVLCICNDRNDTKVRSLASHCVDLRFARPNAREVGVALRRVAQAEGYSVADADLERIATSCNADIRQMLNLLQMWRPVGGGGGPGGKTTLRAEDIDSRNTFKDVQVGPFDVANKFFTDSHRPVDERLRHYFVDSGMTSLMVQDSYLGVNSMPAMPAGLKGAPAARQQLWQLNRLVQASESIAAADVVGQRIARDQTWGLAPLHGVLACVAPGSYVTHSPTSPPALRRIDASCDACRYTSQCRHRYARGPCGRVGFPAWLGKNSTRNKRSRMLRETTAHMQARIIAEPQSTAQHRTA